ncbi:MAG: hypothetical protein IBX72_06120 [Nitrospirae bacterium]|nr:hypothetical protein [Nitrospirota bacterium]
MSSNLIKTKIPLTQKLKLTDRFEPEKYLGAFDSLPLDAQNAIVRAIVTNDRMSMAGHEIGFWHIEMARLFAKLKYRLRKNGLNRASKLAGLTGLIFQSGIAHIIHKMYKLLLHMKGMLYFRQTSASLLYKSDIETRDLAVCYARNIPQSEAYRGFWHDQLRNNTYGVILGIDLIPTPDGCWYIESNLNFGMSNTRSALYDRDPFVQNLVKFTVEQGYNNLVFINNTSSYMNKIMAEQLEEEALANKIKLTIVEDAYLPDAKYPQNFGVPAIDSDNTLVVRTKFYRTSLDYLLQNKRACSRALEIYKRHFPDEELLLPATATEPVMSDFHHDGPFPNLVYKLPERDEGKGLIFLKAASPEHAYAIIAKANSLNSKGRFIDRLYSLIEDRKGIFQSFVEGPLLEDRRLYKVRAHVVITPVGAEFLSSHRVISKYPVPEYLPAGIVQDKRPYLVNLASSSVYDISPPEEEQLIKRSALAVAKGLAWAVTYGFQTNASATG